MSNRVYLFCTAHADLPAADPDHEFFQSVGTEYEAKYSIPLFWLCLFGRGDLKCLGTPCDDDDEDERAYGYLGCPRELGLGRLRQRAGLLQEALGPARSALYREWIARIEAEPFPHILVQTRELDWMFEPGELAAGLELALDELDRASAYGQLRLGPAIRSITGLGDSESPGDCSAFQLVGAADTDDDWPAPLAP